MSSETLDEARRAVMAFPWAQDTSAQHEALNRFEVLVRADAERVQRERADDAIVEANRRLDEARNSATRPYRKEILKRHEAGECYCPTDRREDPLCVLLPDADIEAARKEDKP